MYQAIFIILINWSLKNSLSNLTERIANSSILQQFFISFDIARRKLDEVWREDQV